VLTYPAERTRCAIDLSAGSLTLASNSDPVSMKACRWLQIARYRTALNCPRPDSGSPELEGLLPTELQPAFQERHRLIQQQFPNRDLQLLTPANQRLGRKWSTWRPSLRQASLGESGARLLTLPLTPPNAPRPPMAVQVLGPAAAAMGEVLAMGDQPWCR